MIEFTIRLANAPGMLAAVTEVLANANVNIETLAASAEGDEGTVRIIVDDPAVARRALQEAGASFSERGVLTTTLRNSPGSLAQFAHQLAASRSNIDSMYLVNTREGEYTLAIGLDQGEASEEIRAS